MKLNDLVNLSVRSLSEGGWANTATQDVKLTPALAKKAVALLPRFEKDFNAFLKDRQIAPVEVGKPVGSSAYIERDLKDNPKKEYGDIDVILRIPRLDDLPESKNMSLYANLIKQFAAESRLPYLMQDNNNSGNAIIVKVGDQFVQVDLVKAFIHLSDWTENRMTPEHGLKGSLLGYMYSSLAEVLHLSIGSSGVQSKEKGGELVPFRTIKVDKVHTHSVNIETFAHDIFVAFCMRDGADPTPHPSLKARPGMVRGDIKLKDLITAIKALGKSFDKNDMFGKKSLKNISSYDDFISKIKKTYLEKTSSAASATKFDKAQSDLAKAKAAETINLLKTKSVEIANLLD